MGEGAAVEGHASKSAQSFFLPREAGKKHQRHDGEDDAVHADTELLEKEKVGEEELAGKEGEEGGEGDILGDGDADEDYEDS